MTAAEFPPEMVTYFETRARQREQDIDMRLAELTPRERSLVRDAAVMGYVLGRMDERAKVEFPKDTPILRGVVYAALREDENYKVLRGVAHQYTEPEAES
ncbi:hypothetical protein ABZ135_18525 [Streptomyces sp. NPDC006339]|uniref:hypothetical protein n=1 Tax=Streptomyces sp. NPDC006339 TaxID=3156755 RepID=UPI0033BBF45C